MGGGLPCTQGTNISSPGAYCMRARFLRGRERFTHLVVTGQTEFRIEPHEPFESYFTIKKSPMARASMRRNCGWASRNAERAGQPGKAASCTSAIFAPPWSRQREIAIRGRPPMPVDRPSFSSSTAATMEVSPTTPAEESRPKGPDAEGKHPCSLPDSLSQAPRRGFGIEL